MTAYAAPLMSFVHLRTPTEKKTYAHLTHHILFVFECVCALNKAHEIKTTPTAVIIFYCRRIEYVNLKNI